MTYLYSLEVVFDKSSMKTNCLTNLLFNITMFKAPDLKVILNRTINKYKWLTNSRYNISWQIFHCCIKLVENDLAILSDLEKETFCEIIRVMQHIVLNFFIFHNFLDYHKFLIVRITHQNYFREMQCPSQRNKAVYQDLIKVLNVSHLVFTHFGVSVSTLHFLNIRQNLLSPIWKLRFVHYRN